MKKNFIKNLNNIGYRFTGKNKLSLNRIFKAFQRRFRQELINGILDQECLIISENLSKYQKNLDLIGFFDNKYTARQLIGRFC